MAENIFYTPGKDALDNFIKTEWEDFPTTLMAQVSNFLTSVGSYEEEGVKIRPQILFTNNINGVIKGVKNMYTLPVFDGSNANAFRSHMKSLIPFCKHDWTIYVEVDKEEINYGLIKSLNSLKEKDFNTLLFESDYIKERIDRLNIFLVKPLSTYCINLKGINGSNLNLNFALESKKVLNFEDEISEFVDASFSKLRTTQKKLQEIKTLYLNIFENVFKNVHGCICAVVDKDYVDDGFFEDGIWLSEPIGFSKLFLQSKSYSEQKLNVISQLFIDMLNYDGITIVDNAGRIRAYNVFVENNSSKDNNILGGARKRAAFTIVNCKKKKVMGVYFQSQEGEMFYNRVRRVSKKVK